MCNQDFAKIPKSCYNSRAGKINLTFLHRFYLSVLTVFFTLFFSISPSYCLPLNSAMELSLCANKLKHLQSPRYHLCAPAIYLDAY
jgi:hypothetical protein